MYTLDKKSPSNYNETPLTKERREYQLKNYVYFCIVYVNATLEIKKNAGLDAFGSSPAKCLYSFLQIAYIYLIFSVISSPPFSISTKIKIVSSKSAVTDSQHKICNCVTAFQHSLFIFQNTSPITLLTLKIGMIVKLTRNINILRTLYEILASSLVVILPGSRYD